MLIKFLSSFRSLRKLPCLQASSKRTDPAPVIAHGFSARLTPVRRASILAILVALFLGIALLLIPRASSPAMIQPLPNGIVPHQPSFIHRWIPPTWGWFWRLKEAILGRSKMITLNTTVISMFSTPGLAGPQFADTNQSQAWILANSELDALRRRLEQTSGNKLLSRPGPLWATASKPP